MSIETFRVHLQSNNQDILDVIDGMTSNNNSGPAPIGKWGERIVHRGDAQGEKLAALLLVISAYAPWERQFEVYYEAAGEILSHLAPLRDRNQLSDKAKIDFSTAIQNYPLLTDIVPTPPPLNRPEPAIPTSISAPTPITTGKRKISEIKTSTVKDKKSYKKLKKISKKWEKIAKKQLKKASSKKKQLANDSLTVCNLLKEEMPKKVKHGKTDVPIIAQDVNGKVLGMMLYDEKEDSIYLLGKNPKYLPIRGHKKEVSGVGTALICHVIQEMKAKGKNHPIRLKALPSAFDFYIKLGFMIDGHELNKSNDPEDLIPMVLHVDKMDGFIKKYG